MEQIHDQQIRAESQTRLVEQINGCLRSGDYSRALDLLRNTGAELSNDAQLSELEKRAQDGLRRKAEADRLITKSQELFAQQNAPDAIRLLRQAYALDKNNSLARAILANALVEHAHSIVETDWLEAEKLANQALALIPTHPTAKTIRDLVAEQKKTKSVDDWVSQARKLQSSGDLFAALAWVAEGLAVHPDDPKLQQIHDEIQRDQGARRRQARRHDLEDLRRMAREIDSAADAAAKQALVARIQGLAARYWTDGEILSNANALLLRLGLVPESSSGSPDGPGGPVIFHVPRPAAKPSVASDTIPPPEPGLPAPQAATAPTIASSAPADEVICSPSQPTPVTRGNLGKLLLVLGAVMILVTVTFFFARKHHATPTATSPAAPPAISAVTAAVPAESTPAASLAAPAQAPTEPSQPASRASSGAVPEPVAHDDQPATESAHQTGALLIVDGEDGATVLLNGKLQPQLTQAGQLRLPNLELKEYVVQVSKPGFQDPPPQKIRIRDGEPAKLVFNLQPQPSLASLAIQGGNPGTAVLVDETLVGTIQPDGKLVSTVNPGAHTVELRKEGFKPRQLKKHFVVGETISLAAADAALEVASAELKITFTPADAIVAISKGELPTVVRNGIPLNLVAGTYTLTARTADGFSRVATFDVNAGQSKTMELSLAPNGMSKWDDPQAWKQEGDSFVRKGGDFVLYGVSPVAGTIAFSAMPTKGHVLQWVLNFTDPKNYVLFQMDDSNFSRSVIRNGEKTDVIKVPHKGEKKSFNELHIRVSPTELVHQIRHGNSWTVLDRWTPSSANLSLGKFGFYLPGNDQVAVSHFAYYADLNPR